MPEKKQDPEIEALQSVHAALKPLSADERTRVLMSVYALLGINGPSAGSIPSAVLRSVMPPGPDMQPLATGGRSQARPLSIIELIQEKSPGTNAQRIALFAYYRDKHEGISRFARDELKTYFAKAKEQPPTNYDRDFVEAVKKGWIHEDGADSYVTSKGIEIVESGFDGERKYTKHASRSRKAGGVRPKAKSRVKSHGRRK